MNRYTSKGEISEARLFPTRRLSGSQLYSRRLAVSHDLKFPGGVPRLDTSPEKSDCSTLEEPLYLRSALLVPAA